MDRYTGGNFAAVVIFEPVCLGIVDMAFDIPKTVLATISGAGNVAGMDMVTFRRVG
jgi:hypothetical protein